MQRAYFIQRFLLLSAIMLATNLSLAQVTVTLGSGSHINGTGEYPAPYGNYYEGAKHQMIIRASELQNAGLSAGYISEIGFDVDDPAGVTFQGFTILMKNGAPSSFSSSFITSLDTVLKPVNYSSTSGWNMHALDDSLYWDGTSNIVIETCFNNGSWIENDEMVHTNVGYDATHYYRSDSDPDLCQNPGIGSSSQYRPNIKLTWEGNIAPQADFKGSPGTTCSGTVQFSDLSKFNPTSWKWYFGDGDSSSAQNPTHTYSSSGTYTVTLIASNSQGSDTIEKVDYINVNLSGSSMAPASCTPMTTDSLEGFGIHNVTFNTIDNNSQDAETEGYKDFTCHGTQVYEGKNYTLSMVTDTPTTHNAKAWIDHNNDGSFDPNNEKVLDQESVLYPSNSFTIPTTAVVDTPLRLRVMADYDVGTPPLDPCQDPQYGQAEDYLVRVKDNPFPPDAAFSVSDTLTCTGSVQFTDQSKNAPTGWKWYFGDGDSSTAQNPSHTYTSSGTYDVTLIVYKGANADTLTHQNLVHVNLSGSVKAPSCQPNTLSYCCDYGIYEVKLNNIQHTSGDASEGYQDFTCGSHTQLIAGNGYTIDLKTGPSNKQDTRIWIDLDSSGTFEASELVFESLATYDPTGTIKVNNAVMNERLRMRIVSDFAGSGPAPCKDPTNGQAQDHSVTIVPNPNPPVADFEADSTYVCGGMVQFTDLSTNGPTSWQWDFGDGNTDTVQNPVHTYQSSGTYTVSLTVSNSNGSDTETKTNYLTVDLDASCDTFYMPWTGSEQTDACYGTLMDDGGTLPYSPNSSGIYTIAPSNASSVTLNFISFHFEEGFDELHIYDGPSTSSPKIGSYSGTSLPNGGTITSSSSSITLKQESDGIIEESGFELEWDCSVGVSEREGQAKEDLELYPNPASEEIRIRWTGNGRSPDRLQLFNMQGELIRTVRSKGKERLNIDVKSMKNGLHLLRWTDPEGNPKTRRFIVQH